MRRRFQYPIRKAKRPKGHSLKTITAGALLLSAGRFLPSAPSSAASGRTGSESVQFKRILPCAPPLWSLVRLDENTETSARSRDFEDERSQTDFLPRSIPGSAQLFTRDFHQRAPHSALKSVTSTRELGDWKLVSPSVTCL